MKKDRSIKITKLIIKNFRGIGPRGLEIDIADIVVLVGPNNSGKSTILKAFQLVTSTDTNIKIDDFFEKKTLNTPVIEVWSEILEPKSVTIDKKLWVSSSGVVKEKWTWVNPDSVERIGWRVDMNRWATGSDAPKAPFSNDGAACAYRPSPTYISPFEQPEKQVDAIKKFISSEIYESIKNSKKTDSEYQELQSKISALQNTIREEARVKEVEIAEDLGKILNDLFSNTRISLDVPTNNPDLLSSYASTKDIDFKINGLSLENQGSGMQRALLWSTLKMLASRQKAPTKKPQKTSTKKTKEEADSEPLAPEKTRILLMDEPEICLHPESIRQAKEILYGLASEGEWQIMITTHSPIFIDLAKDNTNIIRVQKEDEKVSVFKTNDSSLSGDEKEQLKMLNIFDPYFAEFFFSKKTIVVEGDTEYTAFRKIIEEKKDKYKDIHIIRARGKYTILPVVKILKKWGKDFSVLHDSDAESNKQSWPANNQILNLVKTGAGPTVILLASKNNFESAFFEEEVTKDKPFNAYKKIDQEKIRNKVEHLLDYLCGLDKNIHHSITSCVCEYKSIEQLRKFTAE